MSLLLISCGKEMTAEETDENETSNITSFQTYEIGGQTDEAAYGVHASEYELWDAANIELHQDNNAREKFTLYDGTEKEIRSTKYLGTRVVPYLPFNFDLYEFDGGTFLIERDSGLGVEVNYTGKLNSALEKETAKITQEEADTFFNEKIWTIADKRFVNRNGKTYKTISEYTDGVWFYIMVQYVDDVVGTNIVSMSFSDDGEILGYGYILSDDYDLLYDHTSHDSKGDLIDDQVFKYDMKEVVKEFTSEEAVAAVSEKAAAIYSDYKYEIIDKRLALLPEGTFGMVYTIEIKTTEKSESGETQYSGDRTDILIIKA